MTEYLGAKAAAELLNLSKSTLNKMRSEGRGPAYCKLGRAVRYRPDDLRAWAKSCLISNRP